MSLGASLTTKQRLEERKRILEKLLSDSRGKDAKRLADAIVMAELDDLEAANRREYPEDEPERDDEYDSPKESDED